MQTSAVGKQSVSVSGCIHGEGPITDPALVCNLRTTLRNHGYLCPGHYKQQAEMIPASRPVKLQPRYKGFFQNAVEAKHIVESEIQAINRLVRENKTIRLKFGLLDPVYMKQVLEG